MLNLAVVGLTSLLASAFVAYNAYTIKQQQFFPTCIYLMKSNVSMLVLVSFSLYCMFLVAYAAKFVLFGTLRLIEAEHLQEYGWLTVSESFLAMTIFRDEFDARFVIIFTSVLFVKAFHWIARDRVDYMEQTARLSKVFHARMLASIVTMLAVDVIAFSSCVQDVVQHGPSMAILFGNEFALLMVSLLSIIIRYSLNARDIRRGSPWEHRSIFLFYYDFVVDLLKLIVYATFFGIVVAYYGVPLHIIRDLYLTVRSFAIRIKDIIRYRRATANMNERYPDATAAELAETDRICIICREEMAAAKKLPCGHLFHFRCLRSWLERQQACPTCRRQILEDSPADSAPTPPAAEAEEPRERGVLVWRNGRWEHVAAPDDAPGVPANPDLRGRPDVPANNAGPAVVFPNLQPAPSPIPNVAQIPGNIIPSPFGTVPVILIPPEQIAIVRPPRPVPTPDPIQAGQRDEQQVPQRPHSASASTAQRSSQPETQLYMLKSDGGQHDPIYLEAIGGELPMSASPSTAPAGIAADAQVARLRATLRRQLRSEVETLSRLQIEIAELTERLVVAESRLDTAKSQGASSDYLSDEAAVGISDQENAESEESNTLLGKQRLQ